MSNIESDLLSFEEACRTAGFFPAGATVSLARAPGRLDVMGGIADYSGSLVAELPIADATFAAAQAGGTDDGAVLVRSGNAQAENFAEEVVLAQELFTNPVSLLRHIREASFEERWAGYAAGCLALLRAEGLVPRGVGARILVRSDVPLGAGVSSSAAIEVACMRALCAAFGVQMSGLELARLCQRVENDVMDAPCGVMDQVTSALGEEGKLLLLQCQPYTLQGTVTLPTDWAVFGLDSRVKHSVGGSAYTRVRVAAFMGYRILADRAKSGFGGYLCNCSPEEYARLTASDPLPETLTGAEFLAAHGGIFDTVTRVEPGETYPVRAATEHPIFENARVFRFVDCLRQGDERAFRQAGQEMNAAHASYTACGLGAEETDLLCQIADEFETEVAGAKITGGGSGGTVCVLCRARSEQAIAEAMAARYEEEMGLKPRLIRGTSPGALATPARTITI